jgi:hypothetical protein
MEVKNITTKKELLKIIHQHCLNCSGDDLNEVRFCTAAPDAPGHYTKCTLWVFRMGTDPKPQITEQNQAMLMNEKRKELEKKK